MSLSPPFLGIQNSDGLRGAPHLSTIHATAGPAGTGGQQELGMMGKPCSQFRRELPAESSLEELRGRSLCSSPLQPKSDSVTAETCLLAKVFHSSYRHPQVKWWFQRSFASLTPAVWASPHKPPSASSTPQRDGSRCPSLCRAWPSMDRRSGRGITWCRKTSASI